MKKSIPLSLLACLFTTFSWVQTRTVTGTVVSDSSRPLSRVNVNVKGTSTTVATNSQGHYSINISVRNDVVLTFSSIGYTPVDIGVGNKTQIIVAQDGSGNFRTVQAAFNGSQQKTNYHFIAGRQILIGLG